MEQLHAVSKQVCMFACLLLILCGRCKDLYLIRQSMYVYFCPQSDDISLGTSESLWVWAFVIIVSIAASKTVKENHCLKVDKNGMRKNFPIFLNSAHIACY